jgi:signal transduction histidine kinase
MRTIVVLGSPERHVERTLAPVRDQEGAIAGWLLLFRDVTEEVELARLRDDMMHMLVHDLRSPLAVLKGSVEVLERSFARRDVERFDGTLEMAGRSIDRMLALVNQLLEINDLESGRLAIHPEAVEASRLLESAAERLRPLAVRAELDVGVRADPNLPLLHVDPELVGRVLHNLLDNAIKFTPNGGRIELWAKPPDEVTLDRLLVGVTDDGIGIPPEAQTRLFKKFQQAVSKKGRRVGTGLGLPFCKLAVEAHGGEIWVESEIGKGSTFVMMLPVEAGG